MFIMNHDSLPETVLQFGAGRFVRAFVERFIQNANDAGQAVGRVVVVQSTPGARADLINAQPQGYHVLVRGYLDGQPVERTEQIASIRRALIATTQWPDVLAVARSPDLKYIVTNATEAGYATDDGDTANSAPPRSMPAKLTRVLWERFQAGAPPLVLLPCELIEGNAARLRDIVGGLAKQWSLPDAFIGWATTIVSSLPPRPITRLPPKTNCSSAPNPMRYGPFSVLPNCAAKRPLRTFCGNTRRSASLAISHRITCERCAS
jgi:tagaturonate reductase